MIKKIIGPLTQVIPLTGLPMNGPISDEELIIVHNGAVVIEEEKIIDCGAYEMLSRNYPAAEPVELSGPTVLLPGWIDAHTHLLFAGSRASDYAKRLAGKSYSEISTEGGGIQVTVEATRNASDDCLEYSLKKRILKKFSHGVTTVEIKSGYGLDKDQEIRHLEIINKVNEQLWVDLMPTCLAAHVKPRDFTGTHRQYLDYLIRELLPEIKSRHLANRIDIFVEKGAFSPEDARSYLMAAKKMGFDLVVHADQFSCGGSRLAGEVAALSADHLEKSGPDEIQFLVDKKIIATALPGASLGLGMPFAPARQLLDRGACLVIASDENPGSAPLGDLVTAASIFGAYEKITTAEIFAGMTFRAAAALKLQNRGRLVPGYLADMLAFPCADYREILYQQGNLLPSHIWKRGKHFDFSMDTGRAQNFVP